MKENQIDNNSIAYISLVQGVLNRMASVSATFKGFSATAFAGVVAIVIATEANGKVWAFLCALVAVVVFALFDWYYFYQEKQYRLLSEKILSGEKECDFNLLPPKYDEISPLKALKSFSLWAFYGVLLVALVVFVLLAATGVI